MRTLRVGTIVVASVLGLMLMAVRGGPVVRARAQTTPTPSPTSPAPVVTDPFGIQAVASLGQLAVSDDLPLIREVGASWVRVSLFWKDIQPEENGPYDWADADAAFARMAALGLKPIVTIRGIPQWAAAEHPYTRTRPSCGPVDSKKMGAYLDFLEALVRRYGVPPYNVKYWEIYNEPDGIYYHPAGGSAWPSGVLENVGGCFGGEIQVGSTRYSFYDAYVNMLRAAYQRIKSVDPQAQVVFGGVAHDWFWYFRTDPTWDYPNDGLFDPYFLDEVIGIRHAGDWFDLMNFHTYYEWRHIWEYYYGAKYGLDVLAKFGYMREQMQSYGYPTKPLMVSEAGVRSYDPDHPEEFSDENQARYVLKLFARILSVIENRPFIWYTIRDTGDYQQSSSNSHGLVRVDGTPKPAFYAYRFGVIQFTGARFLGKTDSYGNTVEGYRYEKDGREFWVLWYKDTGTYEIDVSRTVVRLTSKDGAQTRIIQDGSADDLDGTTNGRVRIQVSDDPVYLDMPDGPIGTPTPTPTATATPTPTATPTATPEPTETPTPTPTSTSIPFTPTPTGSPDPTVTPSASHWIFHPLLWRGTGGTTVRSPHRAPGHPLVVAQEAPTPTPWPTPTPTAAHFSTRVTIYRPGVWGWWWPYPILAALFVMGTVSLVALTLVVERGEGR